MQNKIIGIAAALLLLAGCMNFSEPYPRESLSCLTVKAIYPDGFVPGGIAAITIENVLGGVGYELFMDDGSTSSVLLPDGIYRVSVSYREGMDVFNGNQDHVVINRQDVELELTLLHAKAGALVIKEIYCGGCAKTPAEGTYQSDQYVIIHNNDEYVTYLDGLCLGTLSPYNSTATNPWADAQGNLPDFAPIIQAIWMIGGTGTSFPLEPGADAVICFRGAINHTAQYPMSVNLNRPDYFVCYNPVYFPNPVFHPAPGDQIREDHYLEVVIKTGQANAYTLSINSPTLVLFRPEDGVDIHDFVSQPQNLVQVPGSSIDRVITVPLDWILDGMEVFNGGSSNNRKRLNQKVDAGYVFLNETFKGYSLMRHTDQEKTSLMGYEVLQDSNNSSVDFYESQVQSLHE